MSVFPANRIKCRNWRLQSFACESSHSKCEDFRDLKLDFFSSKFSTDTDFYWRQIYPFLIDILLLPPQHFRKNSYWNEDRGYYAKMSLIHAHALVKYRKISISSSSHFLESKGLYFPDGFSNDQVKQKQLSAFQLPYDLELNKTII